MYTKEQMKKSFDAGYANADDSYPGPDFDEFMATLTPEPSADVVESQCAYQNGDVVRSINGNIFVVLFNRHVGRQMLRRAGPCEAVWWEFHEITVKDRVGNLADVEFDFGVFTEPKWDNG